MTWYPGGGGKNGGFANAVSCTPAWMRWTSGSWDTLPCHPGWGQGAGFHTLYSYPQVTSYPSGHSSSHCCAPEACQGCHSPPAMTTSIGLAGFSIKPLCMGGGGVGQGQIRKTAVCVCGGGVSQMAVRRMQGIGADALSSPSLYPPPLTLQVGAEGLDFGSCSLVVAFDLPHNVVEYMQVAGAGVCVWGEGIGGGRGRWVTIFCMLPPNPPLPSSSSPPPSARVAPGSGRPSSFS